MNIVDKFWNNLEQNWDRYYTNIMSQDHNLIRETHEEIIKYLADLQEKIDIEIMFGQVNYQTMGFEHMVCLYISPKCKLANIPLLNELYNKRKPLKNLLTCKYKPFHLEHSPLIADITYRDIKVEPADIMYQSSYSLDPERKELLLNFVFIVSEHLADKLLIKKSITFDNKEKTTREVYLPNNTNILDSIVLNHIGEYNMMYHVGYMEFLPEDHDILQPDMEFKYLADIRKELQVLLKNKHETQCAICEHKEHQTVLLNDNSNFYCSETCHQLISN